METSGLDIEDSVFLAHSLLHLFVDYCLWSITIFTVFCFYSFLKLISLQLFNYFLANIENDKFKGLLLLIIIRC